MRILTLQRLESSIEGTFGEIAVGRVRFWTGELPWKFNDPFLSCIPAGTYPVTFAFSPKFNRKLYTVGDVYNRSGILIHSANLFGGDKLRAEVEGCIGLGRMLGSINGQKALMKSREAVTHFEQILDGQPFTLKVLNWYPASQALV